jgi:hypothetical protein
MGYILGLIVTVIIALIIAANADRKIKKMPAPKPIGERTLEELRGNLKATENSIEMQKLKYQGMIANPYVSHVVQDMAKK